jgi:hypothetical protein
MATVKVLKPFADFKAGIDRLPGDVFEADDDRASQIDRALPGYIEISRGYETMTVAELRNAAKEAGIQLPKSASKAAIIELLEA